VTAVAIGRIDSPSTCGHLELPLGLVHRSVVNGAMSAGSSNLDSATAAWVASDVGRLVVVRGAGAAGGPLVATILSRTSASRVVLSSPAVGAVAGQQVQIVHYREVSDAAIAAGSDVLSSATAAFRDNGLDTDIGRRVAVAGAGAGGAVGVATVVEVLSDTQVRLSANAATTVANAIARIPRTFFIRPLFSEFDAAITDEDILGTLRLWAKLARQNDGKTLAQMEGRTVLAEVP
jgi:hypothetical protein